MITESDAVNIFGGHSVRTMNMQTVRAFMALYKCVYYYYYYYYY